MTVAPSIVDSIVFQTDLVARGSRAPKWTDAEEQFLRENMGFLMEWEIAAVLGRSAKGVKLHRERMGLLASSKTPGFLTAEKARLKLGMKDSRPIRGWVKKGLVRGHIMGGPRKICMVHEISLRRFVVNPMNWPWFDIAAVRDQHLRRLIDLQQKRWGDEWLTAKQAADILGISNRAVQQYVRLGRLSALHIWNKDGRSTEKGRWANYFVLRSEIDRVHVYKRGDAMKKVTPAALDWISQALTMGWTPPAIGRSMKVTNQTVRNWIDKYELGKREKYKRSQSCYPKK